MTTPTWLTDEMVEAALDAFTEACGAFMADGTDVPLGAMRAALLTLASTPLGELMAAAISRQTARGPSERSQALSRLERAAEGFASSLPVERERS